ncbi:hypothetical protein ACFXPY_06910 [Streptomyces sp. NPDC059153]|uniref:hypothetical protein n=1 Tax=Streptomyces sp. NPDC059153 TaxID=3346743 RepID=UPI00367FF7B0
MPPPTIQTAPPRHSRTAASITEQFHAVDAQHPGIFAALEQLITDRLAAGATRLLAAHPEWASAIEVRRRSSP